MKITERRIVIQEWFETDITKTGWDNDGWWFKDSYLPIGTDWTLITIVHTDKHSNPILGIAEREVEV